VPASASGFLRALPLSCIRRYACALLMLAAYDLAFMPPLAAEQFPLQQNIAGQTNARSISNASITSSQPSETAPRRRGLAGLFDRLFHRQPAVQLATPDSLAPSEPRIEARRSRFNKRFNEPQSTANQKTMPPRSFASAVDITPKSAATQNHVSADEVNNELLPDDLACDPRLISTTEFDHKCLGPLADPTLARKILTDHTLRSGDAIMTQRGIVIFAGKIGIFHDGNEFIPLNQANIVNPEAQKELTNINKMTEPSLEPALDIVSKVK